MGSKVSNSDTFAGYSANTCASFYRNQENEVVFKTNGQMIKWAKQAGKLVLQEAEDFHEDNLVTFCNLALFWHSQGSWRTSHLYQGRPKPASNSLESERLMRHRKCMPTALRNRCGSFNSTREYTRV